MSRVTSSSAAASATIEGVRSITGVKVFSATRAREREQLGERITEWIRSNLDHEIIDKVITQSSDTEFHCLTITLFYKHPRS